MEKILAAIANHAGDSDRADEIYWETLNMDERELARYVAQHDAELRQLLDVKTLSEKDANPEFTSDYFKLKKRGDAMLDPDPSSRRDYYNEELKGIDWYLERLGVTKPESGYDDDTRARYTDPASPDYVGKWDEAAVNTYALEDNADPKLWRQDMLRAATDWQTGNQLRGYNADNSVNVLAWMGDLAEELALPRVREAKLAGRDWSWKDVTGDLAELGLNFVPGVGVVSKSGKVIARVPYKAGRAGLKGVAYGLDYGTVPFVTQAIDVGLYDDDDPRGQWSKERMAMQAGGVAGAKAMLKGAGLGLAGKFASASEGEVAEKALKNGGVGGFIKDIGFKTDDAIATRQAVLDAEREAALHRRNVRMQKDRDISGTGASPDALVNADDFRILNEDLERLQKSQAARGMFNHQVAARNAMFEAVRAGDRKKFEELYDAARKEIYDAVDAGQMTPQRATQELYDVEREIRATHPDWVDEKYFFPATEELGRSYSNSEMRAAENAYRQANEAGARDIVQLPDGRFVYADRLQTGAYGPEMHEFATAQLEKPGFQFDPGKYEIKFPDADYSWPAPDGTKPVTFQYNDGSGSIPGTVSRNVEVEKRILKDPLLARKYNNPGRTEAMEIGRDFVANAGANAAAREGLIGSVMGMTGDKQRMEDKRAVALWNKQMKALRTNVVDKAATPEQRREYAAAVINVLQLGLDNIPDEVYAANPGLYRAIARELGDSSWVHPSAVRTVPDQPTTSYSSAQ